MTFPPAYQHLEPKLRDIGASYLLHLPRRPRTLAGSPTAPTGIAAVSHHWERHDLQAMAVAMEIFGSIQMQNIPMASNEEQMLDSISFSKQRSPISRALCEQEDETAQHILTTCVFDWQCRHNQLAPAGLSRMVPRVNKINFYVYWWRKASTNWQGQMERIW